MTNGMKSSAAQQLSRDMLESVEQQLMRLLATNAHAKRKFASQLQENLPPAAVPILAMALHKDQVAQSEIGEHLMLDKASLSRLITRMEDCGLLVRTLDPADRRVSRISATDLARERWERIMAEHRRIWTSRMHEWPVEDVTRLIGLLSKLNDDLRQG